MKQKKFMRKSSWKSKGGSKWKVQKSKTVKFMKMKGWKGGSRWKVQKSETVEFMKI